MPRCSLCPLFDAERAIRDVLGENPPPGTVFEITVGPNLRALLAGEPSPNLDPRLEVPDFLPEEWAESEDEEPPHDYGRIGTLWARALDDAESNGTRYLYLKGASRTNLPPYGLSDLLAGRSDTRRDIVVVEGFFDLHQLRARGIENVAALGGTSMSPQTFERLHRLGIETVTLCLDNDDAGRAAAARAVEQSARARKSPDVYVVDPQRLAPANDPDELVRQRGPGAWNELLATRACGIEWRARELAVGITRDSPAPERRAALARAGRWLGVLPPRLALEQDDALRAVADRCGYSAKAVERAFEARFLREPRIERDRAASARADLRWERVIER